MSSRRGRMSQNHLFIVVLAAACVSLGSVPNVASAEAPRSSTGSGSSLPTAAVPFSLIFQDDFNGSVVSTAAWTIFSGPGNGKYGPKSRANTMLAGGNLVLRAQQIAGRWYGAGICNCRLVQTYGKYLMRVRFDAGYGVRTSGLLWPAGGGWPPEVDFYEIAGMDPQRRTLMLTNHYRDALGTHMQHGFVKSDYTQWHDVAVEWRPTSLTYKLDGVVVWTMTKHVPQQPMWFGMNVSLGWPHGPDATTPPHVDAQIDWIKIYKYNGSG